MSDIELKKALSDVLEKYDLVGVIYADTNGKNIGQVGNFEALPIKGLIQTLFGGITEIKNLYESIKDQILPQGWGQGKVRVYIDITVNGKIFGVFNILDEGIKFENLNRKKSFMNQIKVELEKLQRKN